MRLAVLSDIHGNLPALEAVILDLKTRAPDLIVNLGDCVSGPLWPRETCDLLMSLNWPTIRGNCDREVGIEPPAKLSGSDAFAFVRLDPRHHQWLAALTQPHAVTDNIFACHGRPSDDCDYLIDDIAGGLLAAASPASISERLDGVREQLTLCGHSHIPRFAKSADGRLVLNPGSVGLPAYDSEWNGKLYFAEAGSPHARYAIVTQKGSACDVEMIAVSYNNGQAAQKAQAEGRPDYEKALRTGMMR